MNIFALLDELSAKDGLAFLMIGGHAVNAYGYSRITAEAVFCKPSHRKDVFGRWT